MVEHKGCVKRSYFLRLLEGLKTRMADGGGLGVSGGNMMTQDQLTTGGAYEKWGTNGHGNW